MLVSNDFMLDSYDKRLTPFVVVERDRGVFPACGPAGRPLPESRGARGCEHWGMMIPHKLKDTLMNQWFYLDHDQKSQGPVSAETLVQQYHSHHLNVDTLVWRNGLQKWQPLRSVAAELAEFGLPLPPPPRRSASARTSANSPRTNLFTTCRRRSASA